MKIIKKVLDIIKKRKIFKNKEVTDIILIQCPPWDVSIPPLGIAYLSDYLKKHDYYVYPFDLNIELYHSAKAADKYLWEQKSYDHWVKDELYEKTWHSLRKISGKILEQAFKKYNTEYVGLSVNFASIKIAGEIIKVIKSLNPRTKIILGGWGCVNGHMRSLFPKELVDVFVIGEGEETLLEVLDKLKGKIDKTRIPGAIFNKLGQDTYESRESIIDLDSIPWPKYSEFNLNLYIKKAMPLFASRGCIGHCTFCNDWPLSKPYRFRSAHNIFEEIQYHVKTYHINYFSFKDLLCNGNIEELNLLCDLIIDSGLQIHWDSQAITRKEMTRELLRKLKRSGCGTLIYGVENFSNNVLRRMKKMFTKEIAEKVLKNTYEIGINACINIIVGFPGETEMDFEENLESIKRNYKYITQIGAVSVCLVNNDSDLEINSKEYGLVLPDDSRTRAKKWYTSDGQNTYEIRKMRADKMLKLIKDLKLSYATITV
ncbi:MAG: B12-binding domain-containing radical SAM protein [Candidatus Omnitrophica bacterium]|nr:B12-binding domain-containing radical SAM protein [Candidatus Omnitrophota bacterium]